MKMNTIFFSQFLQFFYRITKSSWWDRIICICFWIKQWCHISIIYTSQISFSV